jgi:hypothetical protein
MRLQLFFPFILLATMAVTPSQAQNECIDRCFSNFSPMQNGGSVELRNECVSQCKGPSVTYGAIAYGPKSTADGYSYSKDNMADAVHTAMANCQLHGGDCKIVVTFSSGCAAVAAVESKNAFSVGQGAGKAQSQSKAMSACTTAYGSGCQIEAWTCTGN